MKIYENYSLLPNNTFGIDARCRQFVEIETAQEAAERLPFVAKSTLPLMVIGGGSNLLLTKNYEGIIVRSAIKGITVKGCEAAEGIESLEDVESLEKFEFLDEIEASDSASESPAIFLTAGSGECFDDVVATSLALGYYGLENLSIIPGDVGASAVQNIGAYGVEIKDVLHSIEAVEIATGKRVTIMNADCDYAYRRSRFKKEWKGKYFITSVTYKLSTVFTPHLDYGGVRKALEAKGITEPTAMDVRNVIIETRNAKLPDPKVLGNGGSFFMNPIVSQEKFEELLAQFPDMPYYKTDGRAAGDGKPQSEHPALGGFVAEPKYKIPAGWMIEQCGWKGKALGRAAVHDKQALVLVNLGGATGSEIVALCEAVRKDVLTKFGIDIHPEVNII